MARPATGKDVVVRANETLVQDRSIETFREAQAVILPPENGLSMDQVAAMLGLSESWA